MDTPKNRALTFPRLKAEFTSQATIEGKLPFPDGKDPVKPLYFTGSINIGKTAAADGQAAVDGEIVLDALCRGSDGELYSFTSKAPFSHEAYNEQIRAGMRVRVNASLASLQALDIVGDLLHAQATVSFNFIVEDSLPLYTADLEALPVAIETRTRSLEYQERENILTKNIRIREETAFPDVSAVIYTNSTAVVRELRTSGTQVFIEALINMDALCTKRNGEQIQLTQSVPISITEELDDMPDTDVTLSAKLTVLEGEVRSLGEEFGILSIEAIIKLEVTASRRRICVFAEDAYTYAAGKRLKLEKLSERALLYNGERELRGVFTEEIALGVQPAKIVYTGVRAIVTQAVKSAEGVELQGVAEIQIIYRGEEGETAVAKEERAFSINTGMTSEVIEAYINGVTATGSRSGNGASVTYSISIRAEEYIEERMEPMVAAEVEDDAGRVRRSGFSVYYASDGESLFSVGKRFGVSVEAICSTNAQLAQMADASEALSDGDRVVVFS